MKVLLTAAFVTFPMLAWAELPEIDSARYCGGINEIMADFEMPGEAIEARPGGCLEGEANMRRLLAPHWDALPADVRATCEEEPSGLMGRVWSYTLLGVCIEAQLTNAGLPLPFPSLMP